MIEGGGEAEDAAEAGGGFLVARRDGPPLLQPRPEPLDDVAVGVNPVRAADRCLVALGRDGGLCPCLSDMLAEALTAVAPISHDPLGHARQALEQGYGVRQLMRLPRRDPEGERMARAVGDHASLGPIA